MDSEKQQPEGSGIMRFNGMESGTCSKFIRQSYLACLFAFAQRAFCAAAILARASGENTRFFVMTGALLPELPGPLL
jgi:hypothetical protein